MKNSNLVVGIFIGSISITQAVQIGQEYWEARDFENRWAAP